jgi:hypothetical protein
MAPQVQVEVVQTQAPDGRPGVLMQLPDGYVVMANHREVADLAVTLLRAAEELAKREEEQGT